MLKFKPHIQKEIDDGVILPRFKIRRLTPAERDAREAERTKDFRLCVCCQIKRGPWYFNSPTIPVCHQCAWRGAVYGRNASPNNIPALNAAMAVIRALERTTCQMR